MDSCVRVGSTAAIASLSLVCCPLFDSFAAPTLKGVVCHIGVVHSLEPGFRVTCGVDGCTKSYVKFVSYKKDVYVRHRDAWSVDQRECDISLPGSETIRCDSPMTEGNDKEESVAQLQRSSALFILKAREIHKIPQTSLDSLLGDISTFIDVIRSRLLQSITEELKEKRIDMEQDLLALSNSPDIANPFDGLHTEYLQHQYFIKYFNLVVSINIKHLTCKVMYLQLIYYVHV